MIGTIESLMLPLPNLLSRAHFSVDCITTLKVFKHSDVFHDFIYAKDVQSLLDSLATRMKSHDYDLIVLADDRTLKVVLESSMSIIDKIKCLPILDKKNFQHIYSKIGLAEIFKRSRILQPDFRIVRDKNALMPAVKNMGFPCILKGDQSGAGQQTVFCRNNKELASILNTFHFYPAILQRVIEGDLIGIDAFYQKGLLIHFAYTTPLINMGHLETAPSVVRRYFDPALLDQNLLHELKAIGHALGADGFANISCVYSSANQRRYYFEADMRPTAWVNYPQYFFEDPAEKIQAYFTRGTTIKALDLTHARLSKSSDGIDVPLFLRMKWWEVLLNRYGVWRYIEIDRLTLHIYLRRMRHALLALINMRALRKKITSIAA